jgi:hypothetical protein
MDWDSILDKGLDSFSNWGSGFVQDQLGSGGFFGFGGSPNGNPTQGQVGSQATTIPVGSQSPTSSNANQSASGIMGDKNLPLYIIGGAGLIALLFSRR